MRAEAADAPSVTVGDAAAPNLASSTQPASQPATAR
jgi:hypothetical protein